MVDLNIVDIRGQPYKEEYFTLLSQLTSAPTIDLFHFETILKHLHPDHHIFVALMEGKPVGMITLLIEQKLTYGGKCVGHVEDLVVDQGCRGMGVGKQLIEHVCELAKNKNCYKMILNCRTDLVGFYQNAGLSQQSEGMGVYLLDDF